MDRNEHSDYVYTEDVCPEQEQVDITVYLDEQENSLEQRFNIWVAAIDR